MISDVVIGIIYRGCNEIVVFDISSNVKEVEEKSIFLYFKMVFRKNNGELLHLHIMSS